MSEKDLDERFEKAFEIASRMAPSSLAQDVQLRLYAYYKQATFGTIENNFSQSFDLRNAFKTNAWIQVSHLSIEEAKELYIETVNAILNNEI